ncbi:TRAP transporter small permease [Rhodospirillaceae bacterium SYSU D60014]|uniref:TRAP transporter small permease n=1 Tax=Virgifigura deserti TaxID=2268457 RepID=UPI000E667741
MANSGSDRNQPSAPVLASPGEVSGEGKRAKKIEDYIGVVILWILAVIAFLQFFTRYVLNDSAGWTEEVGRYFLIALTFIGAVTASRRNSHIRVVVVRERLPERLKPATDIIVAIVEMGLYLTLLYLALLLLPEMHDERMTFADIPLSVVYVFICLGLAFMAFREAARLVRMGLSLLGTGR